MSPDLHSLSRRERQILEAVHQLGSATVAEVRELLPDAPSYSATRTLLGVLKSKGFVYHERQGHPFRYFPTVPAEEVSVAALQQVRETYFQGSARDLVSTMLDLSGDQLSEEGLEELPSRVEELRRQGK